MAIKKTKFFLTLICWAYFFACLNNANAKNNVEIVKIKYTTVGSALDDKSEIGDDSPFLLTENIDQNNRNIRIDFSIDKKWPLRQVEYIKLYTINGNSRQLKATNGYHKGDNRGTCGTPGSTASLHYSCFIEYPLENQETGFNHDEFLIETFDDKNTKIMRLFGEKPKLKISPENSDDIYYHLILTNEHPEEIKITEIKSDGYTKTYINKIDSTEYIKAHHYLPQNKTIRLDLVINYNHFLEEEHNLLDRIIINYKSDWEFVENKIKISLKKKYTKKTEDHCREEKGCICQKKDSTPNSDGLSVTVVPNFSFSEAMLNKTIQTAKYKITNNSKNETQIKIKRLEPPIYRDYDLFPWEKNCEKTISPGENCSIKLIAYPFGDEKQINQKLHISSDSEKIDTYIPIKINVYKNSSPLSITPLFFHVKSKTQKQEIQQEGKQNISQKEYTNPVIIGEYLFVDLLDHTKQQYDFTLTQKNQDPLAFYSGSITPKIKERGSVQLDYTLKNNSQDEIEISSINIYSDIHGKDLSGFSTYHNCKKLSANESCLVYTVFDYDKIVELNRSNNGHITKHLDIRYSNLETNDNSLKIPVLLDVFETQKNN